MSKTDFGKLSDIGEFGLIDRIAALFQQDSRDAVGIGDDCAVIPWNDSHSLLVTTDLLLEGRHFRREWTSAGDLGYKSLAVNLSDIAAMGGVPEHAFLSIGLPPDIPGDWLSDFFNESHALCKRSGVKLSGGDTTKSNSGIVINYVILGRVKKEHVRLRSDARPGDDIALLGFPGLSGAGLKLLAENAVEDTPAHRNLVQAHHRPPVFLEEARFLGEAKGIRAMIDLSDGIRSDAGHIAKTSGVKLTIDIDKIPKTGEFTDVCREHNWHPEELLLAAGEDYGLLFTLDSQKSAEIQSRFKQLFGYPFSIIGKVSADEPGVAYIRSGKPFELQKHGFDHFKSD